MSGAIPQDAHFETVDDGADELLRRWMEGAPTEPPKEPSEEVEDDREEETQDEEADDEETEETPDSDDEADESEEDGDDEEDEKPKKTKAVDDDYVTKITVDGKEVEVNVGKLKRLYGQEAALTRKSQEVAEKRKSLETAGTAYVTAADTLLKRAQERYAPYAQIDWLVAAKELDGDELQALRTEAQKAYSDVQFLTQEVDSFMQNVTKQRNEELVNEARKTLKELSDPVKGIPGFNQQMYDEMRVFAINEGVPEDVVNNIVSAPVIRMLHKAMLYEKGKKAVTTPQKNKNKTIIKSKSSPELTRSVTKQKDNKAFDRFKSTGTVDDAADVLMARWLKNDD
jgi:hypothetical protein